MTTTLICYFSFRFGSLKIFRCARGLIVYGGAQYRSIRAKLGATDDLSGFPNIAMRFAEGRLEFAQV